MPTIDKNASSEPGLDGQRSIFCLGQNVWQLKKTGSYLVLLRPWSGLEGQLVELVSFFTTMLEKV